jgi:riboflavin kinase/FMN adenylyltransferase
MRVWPHFQSFQSETHQIHRPIALTIGNFDGIHLGHQSLIEETVHFAKEERGSAIVVTFNPHPQAFLNPEKGHARIFSLKDQEVQMEIRGVDGIFRQSFSREFSQISPHDFVENFIVKFFQPRFVCVGENFRFGAFRAGSASLLQELGYQFGFQVKLVTPVQYRGESVSTSQIKKYLSLGDVEKVRTFLGRNYYFQGLVQAGEGRGRQLGFPTANVSPDSEFAPAQGVYVCDVSVRGEAHKYRAVVNIGINKTFVTGEAPLKFEVHILDWTKDLYGKLLTVELLHYIRPEKKFSGLEELKLQIEKDISFARSYFESN